MEDACSIHVELLSIIEHALLGDRLAAEYLLCNLVSNVYTRADGLPLGKLSVNISGCPAVQKYATLLHHLISQLVPQSVLIDMSIDNMNKLKLIPSKDYSINRLTAGMLQLAAGTHLVLNETALHQGQLNQTGVSNIKALADVITWQKVDYDYQWHPIPIPTDFSVLVLSDGESLLPKDIHVPLAVNIDVVDITEHFIQLDSRLTEENLNKLRSYITACRLAEYSLSDDLQKVMQDDFVEIRQINPKDMSVDDFHRLLSLVRSLTRSCGQLSSGVEVWAKVKAMEAARKVRVANLPGASRN
uniref:Mini-chromosome maintenance complex-binding protein n=1 Tax=Arion vulgaris TaxID=1028688 RepID=A0A0B7A4M6_9EUPU